MYDNWCACLKDHYLLHATLAEGREEEEEKLSTNGYSCLHNPANILLLFPPRVNNKIWVEIHDADSDK